VFADKNTAIKAIGAIIRELRQSRGISIHKLSRITGIEYSQLSKIERGKVNAGIYTVYVIIKGLELPKEVLVEKIENFTVIN
jgi:hypothetical protein